MNRNTSGIYILSLAIACVLCLFAACPAAVAQSEGSKLERSELKALRSEAANRPRRILYNDDGCDERPYTTPEELISLRVRQVANTQVDTIFYCTGGGGLFWAHQPKVGEVLGEWIEEGHAAYVKGMRDGLAALKKEGTDPLAVVVDYAHTNRMEVFWSYRMNNPECSYVSWGLSRRKREHPEYLMGDKSQWDPAQQTNPRTWWSLWDFERPEVRDYIVRIFEDVCQRYDVDGIELDFIRHPLFFRPNLDGLPAEPKHVAMMTDMVRRIRAVTERESMKRGRPILVSVRAPLSVKSCMDIGLDVRAFLDEDLVDILIAGQDYIQMGVASSLKDLADLGHAHQVPVYALLVPAKPYKLYMHDNRAWCGAAMNRFYWGADGVYLFNLFPAEPDERFGYLGSVESLRGRDKIYAIDNPAREDVLGTFKMVMVGPDRLPLVVEPGHSATAKLPVGEDIIANTPSGKTVSTALRLGLANVDASDTIQVKLNGEPQTLPGRVEALLDYAGVTWFQIDVDPQLVQAGYNLIDLQLSTERTDDKKVILDFLDLVVTYKDEVLFEETFGAGVQVEVAGRPLIFEGDFNGDGNMDAMAVIRFDPKAKLPKEVMVLKPWGEPQLEAPPRPRALAIVHRKGTQTIDRFIVLGDAPESWSPEWDDLGLEILGRGKAQEALSGIIPEGDVIQVFTQAGINTFLYWDGETYRIFEPDEEP